MQGLYNLYHRMWTILVANVILSDPLTEPPAPLQLLYSIRLIYLTFIPNSNSKNEVIMGVHESSSEDVMDLFSYDSHAKDVQ